MALTAILLVILSGFIHAVWNLFTKRSMKKHIFLWFCQVAAIICFMPPAIAQAAAMTSVSTEGWMLLLLSMLIHGVYMVLLAHAYTTGDLSQVYPIMRGMSPLLIPIAGVLLLHEQLPAIGWAGVACIVVGIFAVGNLQQLRRQSLPSKAVMVALMVGLSITGYTIVDKLALQHFPIFVLNEATNIGNLLALSFYAFRSSGGMKLEWRVNWKTILLGGILSPAGYMLFLKALEILPVAQLAPMREIGTVFGTLFGVLLLREAQGKSRIFASVFITIGVLLLAL